MHGVSRPVFHHEEKDMTLEDRLAALTAAILDLTAALRAEKAESAQQKPPVAPIETAPTPEPTPAPKPPTAANTGTHKADAQAALVAYGNAAGVDQVMAILREVGGASANKLSALDPSLYPAVVQKARAALVAWKKRS